MKEGQSPAPVPLFTPLLTEREIVAHGDSTRAQF